MSVAFKLCSIFQRYKSKAIHNSSTITIPKSKAVFNISKIQIESNSQHTCWLTICTTAVFNISKIQIESNSQLVIGVIAGGYGCVQYFKDTNRKQFTTILKSGKLSMQLCSIFQRYKSKAIHNTMQM